MNDDTFMIRALELAKKAADAGEVPVGAVVVYQGTIIGEGYNQPISGCDPTAHAEMVAIREAANRVGNYRLVDAELYVTLEPCAMCAGAIVHARLAKVIYGTAEPKAGVVTSRDRFFERDWLNHQVEIAGPVLQERCSKMLSDFFKQRREAKRAAKQNEV